MKQTVYYSPFKKSNMGIVKDNYVTSGASGNVGTLWSFRQRAGKTVLAKQRGISTKPPNEKGLALRARFKTSLAYAREAMKDPVVKAAYAAAAPRGVSPFNVAVGDAASSPVVSLIDSSSYHGAVGETLMIEATDNFKVTGVVVTIDNAAGALIETGNAVLQENRNWLYTATVANATLAGSKITATATDLPGNSASLEITLQ
jgi:hypothetical protein